MENHSTTQPTIAAAPFGMPASGRTLAGAGLWTIETATTVTTGSDLVRGRKAGDRGETGFAVPAHIPGTTAWSPPLS